MIFISQTALWRCMKLQMPFLIALFTLCSLLRPYSLSFALLWPIILPPQERSVLLLSCACSEYLVFYKYGTNKTTEKRTSARTLSNELKRRKHRTSVEES